ncbi:MAG TPA: signal recognition particle-docking protein FtsY [Acidimicrobiia bacterium]|jgi:fused signal recognition particle receptor
MALAILLIVVLAVALISFSVTVLLRTRTARREPPAPRDTIATVLTPPPEAPPAQTPAPVEQDVAAPPAEPAVEAPVEVPTVEAPVEVAEPIVKPRLRDRLGRTRSALAGYVRGIAGHRVEQSTWDDLEEALLLADVGLDTTEKLLAEVKRRAGEDKVDAADGVVALLRDEIAKLLEAGASRDLALNDGELTVWMFVGVNGVGKTTTIGKLAAQQADAGKSVVLAAGDTFRAAAAEQLTKWAERTATEIVRGQEGADPGSVVFDAMSSATSRNADLLLVDTAGRLHTKSNLMAELEKLKRIVDRTPGALREVLLVIDATTGQNGLQQAKQFAEAVEVTGIALTKLDGTAKGGIVLAIHDELNLPVKLVGVGEQVGDLIEFDPAEFAGALFE